jgi:hypothetical protein
VLVELGVDEVELDVVELETWTELETIGVSIYLIISSQQCFPEPTRSTTVR